MDNLTSRTTTIARPLTEQEWHEAQQIVVNAIQEAQMRVDPLLQEMNFRQRNLDIAIGYRVRHFYALNDPELQQIIIEARKLHSEIILYTATIKQTA